MFCVLMAIAIMLGLDATVFFIIVFFIISADEIADLREARANDSAERMMYSIKEAETDAPDKPESSE